MFRKFEYTENPPPKNIMIWDGQCGFCKFWKTRWENRTQKHLIFKPYQEVAKRFPDIPLKEFKKASRLIEQDGKVYSGPDSVYRCFWYAGKPHWHHLYTTSGIFQKFSDKAYNHIAKNRHFYFYATKFLFGTDPLQLKPYWLLYLLAILLILVLL
ncbi:MAG: DCC1-like thiol-disulfide oxidoreductase family protein [Salegentibacter mishustinae]|nr:DCC1-like thiol-disulfide oxidoreductase family protein [Salegentibacter mishustinae]